ncbi:HU family DNA-binding protein [Methyloradius palustris]|uniref:Integration host factor subunit beta n=1 Tax=Methyloradius palustris TaxID=2778876 RepID=A0A8D5JQB8_9PROT|nr:HU family DNA-binding protein [Methyloradius palustris]BCM24341.1 integration host factor subunit beta [Methyloradius palustris]
MTRSELITQLSIKFPKLTQADIKNCVESILDSIGDSLANAGRTEIRGFGSFSRHTRGARIGRNPKIGVLVAVSSKASPHFKFSKDLLQA